MRYFTVSLIVILIFFPRLCDGKTESIFMIPSWGGGFSLGGGFSVFSSPSYNAEIIPSVDMLVLENRFFLTEKYVLDMKINFTFFPYLNFNIGTHHSYYWNLLQSRVFLGGGIDAGYSIFFFTRVSVHSGYEKLFYLKKLIIGIQWTLRSFFSIVPTAINPSILGGGVVAEVSFYFYPR